MNQRQAKIKALYIAGTIIQGLEPTRMDNIHVRDIDRMEKEFAEIGDRLIERARKLSRSGYHFGNSKNNKGKGV